ncbi:expressed unknown protein [Seminavis robusta]|uniref:Uncharacterized protein n=1 Tax=Seminavis robusta TaxID=568900 RepID=A0A9N8DTA1_9STRA|nr:expressed unknown protein [Seminavis robusta]|eukprot:Sro354_g124890.1 n/a (230) ;mRNA; r:68911-69600
MEVNNNNDNTLLVVVGESAGEAPQPQLAMNGQHDDNDGVEMLQMECDVSEACDVSVLSDEQLPIMIRTSSSTMEDSAVNKQRRRFFGGRRRRRARVAAVSWWTELKNVETHGCSFVLAYIAMSFILMTLMFNMREIVGDYCLGNKELKEMEHRANVKEAMQIRRRSPFSVDQEDRFEEELNAQLYYDKEGQLGNDEAYLRRHRVPIIFSEHNGEEDNGGEDASSSSVDP